MSLRPFREELEVNVDFICPWTQERGGVLSIGSASGITIAEYATNASGALPLGLQLNDIEHVNFAREYHPQRIRNTDIPCGTVGVAMEGLYETDWLHIVGSIQSGDPAYVGPSGTVTNSASFGGIRLGRFMSSLKADPHTVVFRGLGFSREFIDRTTKLPKWENNPADQILIVTPGYAKVHINQRDIRISQASLL